VVSIALVTHGLGMDPSNPICLCMITPLRLNHVLPNSQLETWNMLKRMAVFEADGKVAAGE
jgi:hypothetical protein